ncbi:MAG TPA: hypothetical protein VLK89_07860 [Solirubrobacterales bacterium]|nr:hypothetical protein [Solirubrobacterales bacterium]
MIHNLKTLGFALAALFAMSTMAASAASAQGFISSDGPVTLEMFETGVGLNATTMFGQKVECPGTVYTGHQYNVTPHQLIPGGATTITVTPHYNNATCKSFPGPHKATITMNGCDYVFHIGDTIGADLYGLTADIVCPAGKVIEKHVYVAPNNEEALFCTYTIKPQAGLVGAHVTTTTGVNDIDITGAFKNIHVVKHGPCGAGTTNAGEWDIDLTVKGKNAAGQETGVTVIDAD